MRRAWMWLPFLALLGGCNWINNVTGLTREANKAIGAACRQTGRSLEDCYQRNPDADKAALYAGWREMHEYMEKHQLKTMVPPTDTSSAAGAGKMDKGGGSDPVTKSSASGAGAMMQPPLSDEAADKAVQNDPQVEAVLSAIKHKNGNHLDAGKEVVAGSTPASGKMAPPVLENDQKKLLDMIKQLNQQAPPPSKS